MKGLTASMLLASTLLGGCEQPGEQYLGTWQDTRSTTITLNIVRNEDQFMVNETRFTMSDDQPETRQIPAIYRHGALILRNGQSPSRLNIDQASGHLSNGLHEFRRIN
ncbi:hypothetical protein [Pseudomonas sp. GOM6]|uniref:hypothetical protein n=1 Tax=Pseudomonas sp. GOM6 TaxID=3036944 RepID=UPI0024091545|nr:hypothetical protein [Pseudomonas sp. GOM6]MDG1581715.1 hypothetical protein [Pseudomonas sp. GOM6]